MPLSQVIMPKTGAEMEEGKIVSWKKKPGEQIKTGEILLEIETDKATMEVESPATGVLLRALFAEDEMVPATNMIAVMMPLAYTPTRCSTPGVSNLTTTTAAPHPIAIGAICGSERR